jgi:hypothetical protein
MLTTINNTDNFKEFIRITPIKLNMFEIKIESRFLDAKHPNELHTRYQGFVPLSALVALHEDLTDLLF